jgi:hypothetical protein
MKDFFNIGENTMKNRCDLEQDLTTFSMIIEELDLLHEMVLDGPRPMTEDEMSNYIFALHCICKLRYEKVWDTYCQVFELDQYNKKNQKSVLDSSYPDGDAYWKEDKQ